MPNSKLDKCLGCKCMSKPFRALTQQQLLEINRNRVEVNFRKGETLIKEGALAGHLVYIRKGLVKVFRNIHNQELILALENRGRLLGIQAVTGRGIYPYSVEAYEDVSVCMHDLDTIKRFAQENPLFAFELLAHQNEDLLFSFDRTACLTMKQLHGRFADLLLCLSLRIYRRKKFDVPLSKKEMAAITNMSQESLSRVIRDFVAEKIISFEGNEIEIFDFEKLRRLSQVG